MAKQFIPNQLKNAISNCSNSRSGSPFQLIALMIASVLLLMPSATMDAQSKKAKPYDAMVTWMHDPGRDKFKGHLVELRDSSLLFVKAQPYSAAIEDRVKLDMPVKNINSIKFRGKGSVGTGALIGAAGGLVIGILVGTTMAPDPADCKSFTCLPEETVKLGTSIFAGGAIGMVGGALIGAGLGSIGAKYELNGDINRYRQSKQAMSKYLYQIN